MLDPMFINYSAHVSRSACVYILMATKSVFLTKVIKAWQNKNYVQSYYIYDRL